MSDEKKLTQFTDKIAKKFGKNSFAKTKDMTAVDVEMISTGTISLDVILGGGMPLGRFVEIYGPESSGKTTFALTAIAAMQQSELEGEVGFIDAEHALDPEYARALGVDMDEMFLSQPDNGEQALEIAQNAIDSGLFRLIVIDSVAALTPKAEIEGEMGDSKMGLHARLMSQACRKMVGSAKRNRCTVIWINQIRQKIGMVFGNPETTTGGNALKFYASQRIEIKRSTSHKNADGEVFRNDTSVKCAKNKVAAPFKKTNISIRHGRGFTHEDEVLDLGVQTDLIQKSGSWYAIDEVKVGQGRENTYQFLLDNPEVVEDLTQRLREYFNV